MTPADYEPFAIALRRCFIACSGGQKEPSPDLVDLFFESFKHHPLDVLLRCLKAHTLDPERGKFVPRPADLVAGLQQFDGHPSADEAWAMSLAAADERATIVWTMPMAMAWDIARHAYWDNRVAAALAFKEAYKAEVQRHRNAGQPAKWIVCLGFDKASTKHAIEQALAKGLITNESLSHEQRALLAPPPSERLLGIAGAAAQPLGGQLTQ